MTHTLLAAVGSGGLVGFTLSLVGGGGSILATPLLLYVVGVAEPHVAIGTGALAVAANAFVNLGSHALKGHVWWRCAIVFAALGSAGALAGSTLGKAIDGAHRRRPKPRSQLAPAIFHLRSKVGFQSRLRSLCWPS